MMQLVVAANESLLRRLGGVKFENQTSKLKSSEKTKKVRITCCYVHYQINEESLP
jgi:hypothetical protein